MTIVTGDTHGEFTRIVEFCDKYETTEDDLLIILGDVGLNYFGALRDRELKREVSKLIPMKLLCIHGNHEQRPETIDTYKEVAWCGGNVYVERKFPKLMFAKDGEIYNIGGKKCIAIGGAYSVDKRVRYVNRLPWWPDEQPSDEIKQRVEECLTAENWSIDIVLSHTCPYKYIPREQFLKGLDSNSVDNSTEIWLDSIEDRLNYKRWYCGHFHTNKRVDKMQFLSESYQKLDELELLC